MSWESGGSFCLFRSYHDLGMRFSRHVFRLLPWECAEEWEYVRRAGYVCGVL